LNEFKKLAESLKGIGFLFEKIDPSVFSKCGNKENIIVVAI